jgi:hypothetical protein
VLARNLVAVPVTDLFGHKGRRWLGELDLPAHEREQVESNLRLHDALDAEVDGARLPNGRSPTRRSGGF